MSAKLQLPLPLVRRGDSERQRGFPLHNGRVLAARRASGLTREEAAARMNLQPRQLFDFEKKDVCVDPKTLKKIAAFYRLHQEFLVRMKVPVMSPLNALQAPFRHWIFLANRDALNVPAGEDLYDYLVRSKDSVFVQLSRPEVSLLLTHLMCRGYVGMRLDRTYYVLDHKPTEVYEQRVNLRASVENTCVAWSFDPKRRDREQGAIITNMEERIGVLEELCQKMEDPASTTDVIVSTLTDFYIAEPGVHIEKAGPEGEMREEMAMKLSGCERIEHDLLDATLQAAERSKRKVNLKPLIRDARGMLQDHQEFVRLAREGALVPALQKHDRKHADMVMVRQALYEDLVNQRRG